MGARKGALDMLLMRGKTNFYRELTETIKFSKIVFLRRNSRKEVQERRITNNNYRENRGRKKKTNVGVYTPLFIGEVKYLFRITESHHALSQLIVNVMRPDTVQQTTICLQAIMSVFTTPNCTGECVLKFLIRAN